MAMGVVRGSVSIAPHDLSERSLRTEEDWAAGGKKKVEIFECRMSIFE
jgi:hypothetical protein